MCTAHNATVDSFYYIECAATAQRACEARKLLHGLQRKKMSTGIKQDLVKALEADDMQLQQQQAIMAGFR